MAERGERHRAASTPFQGGVPPHLSCRQSSPFPTLVPSGRVPSLCVSEMLTVRPWTLGSQSGHATLVAGLRARILPGPGEAEKEVWAQDQPSASPSARSLFWKRARLFLSSVPQPQRCPGPHSSCLHWPRTAPRLLYPKRLPLRCGEVSEGGLAHNSLGATSTRLS